MYNTILQMMQKENELSGRAFDNNVAYTIPYPNNDDLNRIDVMCILGITNDKKIGSECFVGLRRYKSTCYKDTDNYIYCYIYPLYNGKYIAKDFQMCDIGYMPKDVKAHFKHFCELRDFKDIKFF